MTQKKFLNDDEPQLKGFKKPTKKRGRLASTHASRENFIIQSPWRYEGPQADENTLKSLTQPDEALSIRELLTRFSNGLPITGREDGQYFEEDLSHLDNLDFAERAEALAQYKAQIAYIQKLQEEEQKVEVPLDSVEASEERAPGVREATQATS